MASLANRGKMAKMVSLDQLVFRVCLESRELQVTMGRWVSKDRKVLLGKLAVRDLAVTLARKGFLAPMGCQDPLAHLGREEHLVLLDHEVSKACLVARERTE